MYGTKLPRYGRQPHNGNTCWNCCFLLALILSIIAHVLFYTLVVIRDDKPAAIQSSKVQKGIEVTLSAAPKPKAGPARAPAKPEPAKPTPAPKPPVEPPKPVAKPKPAPKRVETTLAMPPIKPPKVKPPKPQPKRPAPPKPVIQPSPPKPQKPSARPKPTEPDAHDVPEFKDDFSELSEDYSKGSPSTEGKVSLDSNPALSNTGVKMGSIVNVNPKITYPIQAQRQGMTGMVEVLIHIAPDGTASSVDLIRSSGYDALDNEVLGAVQHWLFRPPMRGGVAVESTLKHRVVFGVDAPVYDDFDQHWQEIQLKPVDQ